MSGTAGQLPLQPEEEGGHGSALSCAQQPLAQLCVTELSAIHVRSTTNSICDKSGVSHVVDGVTPGDCLV